MPAEVGVEYVKGITKTKKASPSAKSGLARKPNNMCSISEKAAAFKPRLTRNLRLESLSVEGAEAWNMQPLVTKLLLPRIIRRSPERIVPYVSRTDMALLDLEFEGRRMTLDQATILTELLYCELNNYGQACEKARNGKTVRADQPGWLLDVHRHPEDMFGIPQKKFFRDLRRLEELGCVTLRSQIALRKRQRTSRKLIANVTPTLLKIVTGLEHQFERMPWALRYMVSKSMTGRDSENGWSTYLLWQIMTRHVFDKEGQPKRKYAKYNRVWCDYSLEQIATMIHASYDQTQHAIARVGHLVWKDNNGLSRQYRKVLLAPKAEILLELWNKHGQEYCKKMPFWPGMRFD